MLELILLKTNYMIPPALAIGLGASALQGVIGGIQAIGARKKAKKLENELEADAQNSPVLAANEQIKAYYNESMRNYQASPYNSAKFIMGKNLADRSQSTGLLALNKRGMALAGVQNLTAQNLDNTNRLVAQGEQDRRQNFQTLGEATRMKAQDEMTQFDVNVATPYNRKFGLKQMKAATANERSNAGLQMAGTALGNAAMMGMSMLNTPKTPDLPSTPESVVTTPRNLGNTSAPTSFTGRPLSFAPQDPVYGMSQMPQTIRPKSIGKKLALPNAALPSIPRKKK